MDMTSFGAITSTLYNGVIFLCLLLVEVSGSESCTFYVAGTLTATYCESGCCKNACCGDPVLNDEGFASTVLGAVSALVLAIVVITIVACCYRQRCQQYDQEAVIKTVISESVPLDVPAMDKNQTIPVQKVWTYHKDGYATIDPV